jgi:hypothetical protein
MCDGAGMVDSGGPTALFVAHPGHELTLHGWLARTQATVFVLTDGSGSHGISRLPSTTRLLEQVGARAGPVYGRLSDRDVYNALLQGATGAFEDVTRELAGWMCRNPVRAVVADSAEGYNPTHDLCRAMAGAAVALASRTLRRALPLCEYVVTADRRACAGQSCAGAICSRLTDAELERKLRAAAEYEELTAESQLSIERDGAEAYRVECLHPVTDARPLPPEGVPYYERHGEARVKERRYGRVIRYRDHVRPVEQAVWALVEAPLHPRRD